MNLFGSLRSRVITGLALLFVLFLTLATLGIGSLRSQARAMDVELDFLIRSSALATDMVSRVGEQIRAAEGYLLEPTPELGRELIRLGDSSHVLRRRYRLLPGLTPRDQAILNRLSLNQARLEVAYATAHAYRDLGRLAEARAAADGARAPGDTLMAQVRALTRSQEARVDARVEAFRGQVADRQAIVYVLVALAIALGGGAAYLTVRSIDAPLQELIASARRFGEGDLRPAQLGAMPRELATLAQAMGTMGSRLRSVIDSTVRESRGISLSAGDLSAMSEELAASSHEIVKAVGGVTASAEAQVLEVRNAEGLLARLREASAQDLTATERVVALGEASRALSARHGTDLTAAADALALLRDEVRRAAQEARELGRFIARVSEIRDLAQQLASESDVLALNASVEAARGTEGVSGGGGGGVGRAGGFTAVAEETRRLAESSRSAAGRVASVVEAVEARTETVLGTLQHAASRASEGEATTRRSSVALQEIGRLVDAMRDIATRVARSAEESKQVGARFADLRAHLERIAQENVVAGEAVTAAATQQSEATDDIATSAAGLLEASERLAGLVAGFRT